MIDLRFLTVGSTTRAEVLNAVGAFESGASADRFLWCRWELSKAGVAGGAMYGEPVAKRIWSHRNLVAVFDANETLEWFRLRPDGELVDAIWEGTRIADYKGPDYLKFPFYRSRTGFRLDDALTMGTAEVDKGVFRRRRMGDRKSFSAPVSDLRDIALGGTGGETDLLVTLRFAGGKSVKIGAEPVDLVRLMAALRQAGFSGPRPPRAPR